MDEEEVVCIYKVQYDSATKNELNLAICNNMNEQRAHGE